MSADKFFPPRPASRPTIYAYEDTNPQYAGLLKVGYTAADVQTRVAQQYPTLKPGKPPYRIVPEESAMRDRQVKARIMTRIDRLNLVTVKNKDLTPFAAAARAAPPCIMKTRNCF